MLYPQSNSQRKTCQLADFWDLRFDPQEAGQGSGWANGFSDGRPIAVPASWNEQFEDGRDFLGPAWYQTGFSLPWGWEGKRLFLRFGSVNYQAEVWLNGQRLGSHEGGHLPFEFDVTPFVRPVENRLVVCVDGRLAFDRVPPGDVTGGDEDFFGSHAGNFPQTQFDFFPFCGIHRPVLLYAVPQDHIKDVTVQTEFAGATGKVHVRVECEMTGPAEVRVHIKGHGQSISKTEAVSGVIIEAALEIPDAALWTPSHPNLYDLSVELIRDSAVADSYSLKIGVRTIKVEGGQLLLNGEPIYLKGFGRHEDFPVVGRGYLPALIVKDYALMKWTGANSFRTTHYPYSEQMLDLADQLGFMVIDETPAVGLFFREDGLEERRALCSQYVSEMIARDRNHPSVIAWSLANEPHSAAPNARPFFDGLYRQAKSLDATRPVTLVSHVGVGEEAFEFCDLVCMNRYYGWYSQTGRIEEGVQLLSAELDALYEKFRKPLIMTEFGADAIPGHHAQPPEMFSEEYQAELITRYIELFRTKPFIVGEHVWNLCDFRTSQGVTRAGSLNHKGVFTRDRRPKLAAHRLRELWRSQAE